MEDLLLNQSTRKQLESALLAKPHALVLNGSWGAGKETIADRLACQILGVKSLKNQPYVTKIVPDNNSIGIEAIRNLRDFLSRKTTGEGQIRRVVLIIDGNAMTIEAQNALLKSLEEPPNDTVIIMTVSDLTSLQPTILSRAQQIQILPVGMPEASKYFKDDAEDKVQMAHMVSAGYVGLISALLNNDTEHELTVAIKEAKQLMQTNAYERLVKLEPLSKQKETLPMLLLGFQRVIMAGLHQASAKNNATKVKQFLAIAKNVALAQDALHSNVNAKLVLTDLFLSI